MSSRSIERALLEVHGARYVQLAKQTKKDSPGRGEQLRNMGCLSLAFTVLVFCFVISCL